MDVRTHPHQVKTCWLTMHVLTCTIACTSYGIESEVPAPEDVQQSLGSIPDALLLEPRNFRVTMGDCHPARKVSVSELELLHECANAPLQPGHIIFCCHAAAVQQIVDVDEELIAGVHMVYDACNLARAVIQLDGPLRGIDIVEQCPAAAC
jgi:hypothetical protein